MSEHDDDDDGDDYLLSERSLALVLFLIALLAVMVSNARQDSQLRDLQRRVGQLESRR
jgi:hypothetical protein